MKIKDLILELSKHDQELQVCLSGYEGGVYCPVHIVPVTVALDVNDEWYYGPHEQLVEGISDYPGHEHELMVKLC